jgi:hypothetical protein
MSGLYTIGDTVVPEPAVGMYVSPEGTTPGTGHLAYLIERTDVLMLGAANRRTIECA